MNKLYYGDNPDVFRHIVKAFEDTWRWDQVAAKTFQEVVEAGGKVSRAMKAQARNVTA